MSSLVILLLPPGSADLTSAVSPRSRVVTVDLPPRTFSPLAAARNVVPFPRPHSPAQRRAFRISLSMFEAVVVDFASRRLTCSAPTLTLCRIKNIRLTKSSGDQIKVISDAPLHLHHNSFKKSYLFFI